MNEQQLRERLQELHQELEQTDPLDAETRRLLKEVLDDIHQALDRAEAAGEGQHESFVERLRDALTRFEGAHPKLTAAVEQIAETLSNAGI